MKCETKIVTTIVIELDQEQKEWLKEQMRTPLHTDNDNDINIRRKFWVELGGSVTRSAQI